MDAYTSAVKEITDARRDDLDNGLIAWQNALADDKLHAAFVAYQTEAVKRAQKQPNTLEKALEKLKTEAKRVGIKKETVEPPCRCKLCNDTGYVNGKYCKCVIRRVINSDRENLTLPKVDFNSAYKTAPTAVKKIYDAAKPYIAECPNGKKPFFIIAGSSGTGKTVLASAIANEILNNGGSAVTVSAFEFTRRAKDYHTQFAIDDYRDLFTPMLECDVLVIDDLGTETMLKNVTREYLYTVINERWLRRKYTVITTNLSPAMMLDRYGEAIFSRMCDKSLAHMFTLSAPNARTSKKSDN